MVEHNVLNVDVDANKSQSDTPAAQKIYPVISVCMKFGNKKHEFGAYDE